MSRKWWKNLVKGENNQTTDGSEPKAPVTRGRHARGGRARQAEATSESKDLENASEIEATAEPEQMALIPRVSSPSVDRSAGLQANKHLENETVAFIDAIEASPELVVISPAKNIYIPDEEAADDDGVAIDLDEELEEELEDAPIIQRKPRVRNSENVTESEEVEDEESEASSGDIIAGGPLNEDSYDDFETVYDLDRGSPFRGSDTGEESARLPWKNYVESAKEFFNAEILYRFDILTQAEKEELSGTYRIELRGYKGGIWTLRLAAQLEVNNRREEADVVLSMRQSHFLQIVNGEMNPQLAILAKKVRIIGNVRRALAFQNLLAPVRD